VIPLRSQQFEKPSIAAVAHLDVDDLRRRAEDQGSIVEIHVLAEDHEVLRSATLPNLGVGRR
jgi:hypothetical protein